MSKYRLPLKYFNFTFYTYTFMFRIQWHVLPENQVIWTALTMIYGIGLPTSKKLLEKFSIPLNKRVKDITEDEQKLLGDHMKDNMEIESDLRREVGNSIKRLKEIRCYRGMRHNMWLPVRWQRTSQNTHTDKKLLGRSIVITILKK